MSRFHPIPVFVFLLAALAAGLTAQVVNQEDTQRLSNAFKLAQPCFLSGQSQLAKGKLEKAAAKLRECLQLMPEHADAHYLLGEILYRQQGFAGALNEAMSAEANFRIIAGLDTIVRQIRLGRIQERRQELQDVVTQLEAKMSQLRGSEAAALQAQISGVRGQIGQLDTLASKPVAEGQDEPAEYRFLHGNALFKLRDFNGAMEQYKRAVEIDPRRADAWNNLANIYFIRREYAPALECLEKAAANGARINPDFKAALLKALGK